MYIYIQRGRRGGRRGSIMRHRFVLLKLEVIYTDFKLLLTNLDKLFPHPWLGGGRGGVSSSFSFSFSFSSDCAKPKLRELEITGNSFSLLEFKCCYNFPISYTESLIPLGSESQIL